MKSNSTDITRSVITFIQLTERSEWNTRKNKINTGMCRLTTFRPKTDRIYDGGLIRL